MGKLFDGNRIDPLSLDNRSWNNPAMAFLGSSWTIVFASAPESLMVQMLLQSQYG
jgi:hypothetical protein